jgi:hypothetical protein
MRIANRVRGGSHRHYAVLLLDHSALRPTS